MNILLLAPQPFFQHRGTPIAVKLLVEVLAKNGHSIHILTYHEGEDILFKNIRIHRIPKLPGVKDISPGPSWKKFVCDFFLSLKCFILVRRFKFDIIHAVEEAALISIIVKLLFKIPYVYDMDSSLAQQMIEKYPVVYPLKPILEYLEKISVRQSIGVLSVCKNLENIAYKYDPYKSIVRLEDVSLLKNNPKYGDSLNEKLKLSGPIVMYVGNLEKYQGIDLLLDSFRIATEKIPDAKLIIIGGSETDIKSYEQRAENLGIKNNTHLIGPKPITQLGAFLEQADVLVSPRIKGENTPMKIYSYLDSGRPVIATRLPTHTQVLDDQIAILPKPNPQDMAEGMITLLTDKKFGSKLADLAKERVRAEYSYEAFEKKLLKFYNKLEAKLSGHYYAYIGGAK